MANLTLHSVNIAIEGTMLFVLIIMILTMNWQKKLFSSTVPLIYTTSFIILNLVVQIVTWALLNEDVLHVYGLTPMRIVYILDYFSFYGASAGFYFYIEALGSYGYERMGVTYNPSKKIKKLVIAWGVVTTFIYGAALFVPYFYSMENGVPVFSVPAYVFMHIISEFACVCCMLFLFRHRKAIGKPEAVLSIVFIIFVSAFAVVDELFELCIGHMILAIFIFVIYVRIDLHKGLLLERQEKEIAEEKTRIMLSQMQPHFLYNVLTTISSMCEIQNATQARDVVNRFADYFRANLDSLGKEKTISFEKELEHVKTYLWLEKVRFEDALNICYEIGPTSFAVPSLTIQPMVENAVKHGILPKENGGTLTIRTSETDDEYVITVEDDGVGFDINEPFDDDHEHVGIENVSRRLEIICNGSLEIQSKKNEGTVVTIRIPKGEQL